MSAVIGRKAGSRWLLRIEDLDATRSRPDHVAAIFDDLDWLGLAHDGEVLVQSQRTARYAEALEQLRAAGVAYPCFCTRADIAAALSAPHGSGGSAYPGTCRGLADDPQRRSALPHSWRLDSARAAAMAGPLAWTEADGTRFAVDAAALDDVILARKDAPAAYHLACVVDDHDSGVELVVRGADLRSSTPVQRLLQALLGLPEPRYLHHPLVTHDDGRRLAKRDLAPTLAAMREDGVDGRALAEALARRELPLGFRLADA